VTLARIEDHDRNFPAVGVSLEELISRIDNLKANPDTTIQIGSISKQVSARIASDEERELLCQSS
jgi:hypothetical protein